MPIALLWSTTTLWLPNSWLSPQSEVWKCNDGKENKEGIVEETTKEANYVGDYKRGNPFSNT